MQPMLQELASKGLSKEYESTTGLLAKKLNMSQQSASRILGDLKSAGLITLTTSPAGFTAKLTEKGMAGLREEFEKLASLFLKNSTLKGRIVTGLGEGKYYMGHYKESLSEAFSFIPYLGTLNIKVNPDKLRAFLAGQVMKEVKGFTKNGRTFGPVYGKAAWLEDIRGALIFPERTSHAKEIIEFIAPEHVRHKLALSKGAEVTLSW
ncbi:MAG: DUF120 domain-containing protein [Nanoarchaeota archaeon]